MRTLIGASLIAFSLAACGGEEAPAPADKPAAEKPADKPADKPATEKPADKPADGAADAAGDKAEAGGPVGSAAVKDEGQEVGTSLDLSPKGDEMLYAVSELKAKAGLTRITLKNTATLPAMVHNVVIVKAGQEDAVGQAAIGAGAGNNWVPEHEAVLAASTLTNPGEETTLVFDLPAGEYSFICTYPGHYATMRGKLIVE